MADQDINTRIIEIHQTLRAVQNFKIEHPNGKIMCTFNFPGYMSKSGRIKKVVRQIPRESSEFIAGVFTLFCPMMIKNLTSKILDGTITNVSNEGKCLVYTYKDQKHSSSFPSNIDNLKEWLNFFDRLDFDTGIKIN